MKEISETEIKSMTKEQNYIRGYKDGYVHGCKNGKSDVLEQIRAEISAILTNSYDEGVKEKALQIIDKHRAETGK